MFSLTKEIRDIIVVTLATLENVTKLSEKECSNVINTTNNIILTLQLAIELVITTATVTTVIATTATTATFNE